MSGGLGEHGGRKTRKKKRLTKEEMERRTTKLAIQVVAEFEKAHQNLSEEGSTAWMEAFEALKKVKLAPILALLTVMVTPIIFYACTCRSHSPPPSAPRGSQ